MRKAAISLACVAVIGLTAGARADEKIDPKAVIDKAIKAAGGADNLAKYKAESFKGTGKFYPADADYSGEWDVQAPDKIRIKITGEAGGVKFVFQRVGNGDKLWVKMGDTDATAVEDKEELAENKEAMYVNGLTRLLALKSKDKTIDVIGEEKVDGKPALGLRVSSKGHRDVSLYFDKEKGLLVKTATVVKDTMAGGKEVNQETLYSDYKETKGLLTPRKVVVFRDGKKYVDTDVTEISVEEKLDDKLFEKP
jgi:outer membrane lipoprotein-sorting protein